MEGRHQQQRQGISVGVPLRVGNDYRRDVGRCFEHYHRGALSDAIELAGRVVPCVPPHDRHAFAQLMLLSANVESRRCGTFADDLATSASSGQPNSAAPASGRSRLEEAIEGYEQIAEYIGNEFGADDVRLAPVLLNHGVTLMQAGRVNAAARFLEASLVVLRKCFTEDHVVAADAHHNLGVLCERRGGEGWAEEARAHYVQSLKIRSKFDDACHAVDIALIDTITNVAMLAWRADNDPAECLRQLQLALPLARRLPKGPRADLSLAAILGHCGACSLALNSPARALPYLGQAHRLRQARLGDDHPESRRLEGLLDAARALDDERKGSGWAEE